MPFPTSNALGLGFSYVSPQPPPRAHRTPSRNLGKSPAVAKKLENSAQMKPKLESEVERDGVAMRSVWVSKDVDRC
jgi:hypothetical protein